MKITDRFVGDHKTFRKLMKDIDTIGDLEQEENRRKLIRAIELFMDHLLLHAWGEDTFYYPEVKAAAAKGTTKIDSAYMIRMEEEHESIDTVLQQVENLVKVWPVPKKWREQYDIFRGLLVAHMTQEEEELFPLSEEMLGKEALERISDTLEKNRKNAPAIRLHQRV